MTPIEQMPVIMLLVTIAVLFAISYLVTDASLKGTREVSFEIKSDSLDKQYLFWLGIIVPIGIFFYLEYFVFLSNEISFNSAGFSTFFNESKLPLGVLALSPIFAVIVSNIHRTIQTEKQISVSEQKNISDSFYSHHKFIVEELKSISEKYTAVEKDLIMTVSSPNILYRNIYKNSNISNGGIEIVDVNFISSMNGKLELINIGLIKLTDGISEKYIKKTNQNIDFPLLVKDLSKVIEDYFRFTNIQCGDVFTQNYLTVKLNNKSKSQKEELDIVNQDASTFTSSFIKYQSIDLARHMIEYIVFYIYVILNISEKILDIINIDINKIDAIMNLKKTIIDIYTPITEALEADVIVFKKELEKIIDSTSTKK